MIWISIINLFFLSVTQDINFTNQLTSSDSLRIDVYRSYEEFNSNELKIGEDSVLVVNLWATWCVPCIKELPYFEALEQEYKDEKFRMTLVSIDFREKLESKVIPFIKRKGIKSRVVLFDDPKTNVWINKIDPSWSGAIPITLVIKGEKKYFYEREFNSLEELKEIVEPLISD